MTDSLSQYCLNCETQANTIEELRAANERWVIAFKQAEADANGRIEALQAENARLLAVSEFYLAKLAKITEHTRMPNITLQETGQ
jgi:hypothetical protein